jgi:hypothetical protein
MLRKVLTILCLIGSVVLSSALARRASAQDETDLVRSALANPRFSWRSVEAGGIRIYYETGSFAERHRSTLLRSAQTALDEVCEFVGGPAYGRVLNLLYVDSRERMKELVGQPYTGYAVWSSDAIFLVCNPDWRSFEKHEMTHVLTIGRWGFPDSTSRWMIEGIAVAGDGWCQTYSVDQIAARLAADGELPPIGDLFTSYRELGEIRAGFYGASVIGYIRRTYGTEAVRGLWTRGTAFLRESLGCTAEQLEDAWRSYLRETVSGDTDVDLESIMERGCG